MKLYSKEKGNDKEKSRATAEEKKVVRYKDGLDVINARAAGLDLHKETIVACAPMIEGEEEFPIRIFRTYTRDIEALGGWLKERGVNSVAMEATGVFWKPVVEGLRREGLEILLVNAREVRSVKGRPKTDKADSQWLRRLHACGLLRGSFIPDEETAGLKKIWRHRQSQEEESNRVVQRIQKVLQQMNVRLDIVVTDVVGETGIRILEAILRGERDPRKLAKLRDRRVLRGEAEMEEALRGNYHEEDLYLLRENLRQYQDLQRRIRGTEEYMSQRMERMEKRAEGTSLPPLSKASKYSDRGVPSRRELYEILGVDLTQITGIGVTTVTTFLVNAGRDMSPWPTAKHFVSWLGLSPVLHESAGRKKSAHSKQTSSQLAQAFRMAGMIVGQHDCYLGSYYRRLKGRIGAAKAITATARKLASLFYHAVKKGEEVINYTSERYEATHQARTLANLRRKAARYGFELTPLEEASL